MCWRDEGICRGYQVKDHISWANMPQEDIVNLTRICMLDSTSKGPYELHKEEIYLL
jgi:hypothetical protein